MNRFLILLVTLTISAGLYAVFRPGPGYANLPPTRGQSWVAFGDSLTSGHGAAEGGDYPSVLGKRLGIPMLNLGTPGATTQDGVERLDDVLRADPRVVLLCFGGNDTLRSVPHDQTFQNLSLMIDRLQNAGAFVVLIGIRSASVLDKYHARFKALGAEKRVLFVPDILDGVLGNPGLMSDYVHPNDEGYRMIAERLEKVLEPFLPQLRPSR